MGGAGNARAGEAGCEIIEVRPPPPGSSTIALIHVNEQMTIKYYAATTARKPSRPVLFCVRGLSWDTARATYQASQSTLLLSDML